MTSPSIHPSIHAPYSLAVILANLLLFFFLQQILPITQQLHSQYQQQLPGLAQLMLDYSIPAGIVVAAFCMAQLLAFVVKSASLYHQCMAASILSAMLLMLTLVSASLLPMMRFVSVIQG